MLKRALILLLFISFHVLLHSQGSFEPTTHVGVHGGMNLNTVSFNPALKQDLLPVSTFGIFFRHVSEPNIGLQLEINLSEKGWTEEIDSVRSYTRRIETLTVPVMAAFIAGKHTVRFAFTIGPYVSYRLREKETGVPDVFYRQTQNGFEIVNTKPHFTKPLSSKWEFGYTGGLAFEFHTRIGVFALRASYSHAQTNMFSLNDYKYYFSGSKQQVIHAGLMYFITF